jgi:Lon protease-like protein
VLYRARSHEIGQPAGVADVQRRRDLRGRRALGPDDGGQPVREAAERVELDAPLPPLPLPSGFESLAQLLETIMRKVGAERFPAPARMDDAAWVAYRLAETLPLEAATRQRLIEARDPLTALNEVNAFLQSKSVTA